MKSQKGVTLTSLAVYIVLLIIILGILGVITANFQNSVKDINQKGAENVEIDKFNIYFLQEVKKTGNGIELINPNSSEIKFTTGNTYTFREGAIYLNDSIKIAQDIIKCEFSQSLINGKTIIIVNIQAKNNEKKTIEYVLNDQQNVYNYEDESSYVHTDLMEIQNIENNQTNNI